MNPESAPSVAVDAAALPSLEPTSGPLTFEELQLAGRNRSLPLEALRYATTPTGLHYVLVHWDIPDLAADGWRLGVDGLVQRPLELTLADLLERPARTLRVTMECAGNGRARLEPRPLSQPWLNEAVGTATWTGTPLAPILEEAGIAEGAVEIVFTGADRGVQGGIEQAYGRSLSVADAMRDEVLIATEMNGRPLEPQHGFPARLLVPGWYGMASVKWLTAIRAVAEPFTGFQQTPSYRYQQDADDPGEPVTRIRVRALMVPPGIPDFFTRRRFAERGRISLTGRAWSGHPPVERVEVGIDGAWHTATLDPGTEPFAWQGWTFDWDATPGDHLLVLPGHGRIRDRAAHQATVELPGDGQQPHPGGRRQRPVGRAGPGSPRGGSTRRPEPATGRGGAPGGTRTHDLQVRNLTLYPLSYGRREVAEREGFEPSRQVTPPGGLANRCTRPLCDLSGPRRRAFYQRRCGGLGETRRVRRRAPGAGRGTRRDEPPARGARVTRRAPLACSANAARAPTSGRAYPSDAARAAVTSACASSMSRPR